MLISRSYTRYDHISISYDRQQKQISERKQFLSTHNGLDHKAIQQALARGFDGYHVDVKHTGWFNDDAENLIVSIVNPKQEKILHARLLWYPDVKILGVESIGTGQSGNQGIGTKFYSNILDLGQALGADKLKLLAGEENGVSFWAKAGVVPAETSLSASSGGLGREQGERFQSWPEVCITVQNRIIDFERRHPQNANLTPEEARLIEAWLDPLKPSNMRQLVGRNSPLWKISWFHPNEELRFNGELNFRDQDQLGIARNYIADRLARTATPSLPNTMLTSYVLVLKA